MGKDVIIACDFSSDNEFYEFIKLFKEQKPYLKIGMEMFYGYGADIVKFAKEKGYKIFLDLKLHDIPNTVSSAMKALSKLDFDMVNVHCAGGSKMMKAAAECFSANSSKPLVIGVTQLTSIDQSALENELLIKKNLNEVVASYARNAADCGLDGVVCSPLEAELIHGICGKEFITVTPGIRYPENSTGDQKRIATPNDAKSLGADYIVVGRPITRAKDPISEYNRFMKDFI